MRRLVVVGMLGGCVGVQAGAGAHAPIDGSSRVIGARGAATAWYAVRPIAVEAHAGYLLGPQSESRAQVLTGGTLFTPRRGGLPGLYAGFDVGTRPRSDGNTDEARTYGARAGVTFGRVRFSEDNPMPASFAQVRLGVAYYRQRQEDLGRGDFFGLELTFAVGINTVNVLADVKKNRY